MTESNFRQQRKKEKITPEEAGMPEVNETPEGNNPSPTSTPMPQASFEDVMSVRKQSGMATGDEDGSDVKAGGVTARPADGISVKGNMPPAMRQALQDRIVETENEGAEADVWGEPQQQAHMPPHMNPAQDSNQLPPHQGGPMMSQGLTTNDADLNILLTGLSTQHYEEVLLPSRGHFYEGTNMPTNGIVHLRPMTGQEETILSTVRFMRGGKGIEMIFRNCLQEQNIATEKLLSIDRTFLLIYLRAISYGNLYEVSVRCPECSHQFDYDIDLNLPVEYCPEDFTQDSLTKQLPKTGYVFNYRLMTGQDETEVGHYRDHKAKFNNATDDSFMYRAALLINDIGNEHAKVSRLHAIQPLLNQLPAVDVNYIRNMLNEPPFGVNTEVKVPCQSCTVEFPVELPYEANFFFPREKTEDNLQ